MERDPGSPFYVGDEGGAKLGVVRERRVVGREAEQRRETEPLLRGDPKPAVVSEHVLVSAQLLAVAGWAAEDFAPPGGHMCPMLLVHAAREERRQQLVALDAIVERVHQAPDRLLTSCPLKERLHGVPLVITQLRTVPFLSLNSEPGTSGWCSHPPSLEKRLPYLAG